MGRFDIALLSTGRDDLRDASLCRLSDALNRFGGVRSELVRSADCVTGRDSFDAVLASDPSLCRLLREWPATVKYYWAHTSETKDLIGSADSAATVLIRSPRLRSAYPDSYVLSGGTEFQRITPCRVGSRHGGVVLRLSTLPNVRAKRLPRRGFNDAQRQAWRRDLSALDVYVSWRDADVDVDAWPQDVADATAVGVLTVVNGDYADGIEGVRRIASYDELEEVVSPAVGVGFGAVARRLLQLVRRKRRHP